MKNKYELEAFINTLEISSEDKATLIEYIFNLHKRLEEIRQSLRAYNRDHKSLM